MKASVGFVLVSYLSLMAGGRAVFAMPEAADTCRLVHVVPERLPDLGTPRCGHSVMYVGGELTVFGGHSTHFVPIQTSEYYANGNWHEVPMAYVHDDGFAVQTGPDEVLLGGGHTEPLGVGRSYTLERYIPSKHLFEGFGCLDRRRTLAQASCLEDGSVIIAGNHFADDAIGIFDGIEEFRTVKEEIPGFVNPFILRTDRDNALIVGDRNPQVEPFSEVWAEQVHGEAFRVPLLEQWRLYLFDQPFSSESCFIGSGKEDEYAYLLLAKDSSEQVAFIHVRDTSFSMLPTVCPLPVQSSSGPLVYTGYVIADRERQRAYATAMDTLFRRQYILAVDYGSNPSPLTLYYTDLLEHATFVAPVLTHEGDLILAGGFAGSNYQPLSAVWRYPLGEGGRKASRHVPVEMWLWAWLIMAMFCSAFFFIRRRRAEVKTAGEVDEELMERLCSLLEEKQLYLRSHITQADIASALGVRSEDISRCIEACRGINFSRLVAEYRVRHAMDLLTSNPDMKLYAVMVESGFTSESTFFRTFKVVTGMSPKEWLAREDNGR